ncbi:MAG: MATE family efflux transporter [Eubacteriales bacterium]|nr:MATE family efflux transporter [Eubacteriales bacterium]
MNQAQEKQFEKMTKQPVPKLLLRLSIPTILSMMVTNIYNIADTAFVGMLGTSQSGATGIVFGFMAILQAVAFMCGQGAGSIMSRKLGEKNIKEATEYTSTGFFLSFGIGVLMGIGTLVFMNPLLRILGSTETIAPYAKIYVSYIAIAAPFFTSSLTMNNLLRYEGKAKLGTVGMMTGAILNIGIDAILMLGLKMGIAGAGIATATAQFISFCILLYMFLSGKTQTKIGIQYFSRDVMVIWNVIAIGFPSLLRQGLNSVATMLLNRCAGLYGDAAVSAMSCVSRIGFFSMAIAIGIGQGFQPISSFNLGAGKKERVRKAFWTAFWGEECVLFVLAIPMIIFAAPLIQSLRDDAQVIEIGVRALRLICISQLFVPLTMMVEMGFQSMGEKAMASFCSSLRSGVLFIPTLLIFAKIRGLSGVQEAQPLSIVLSFVVGIFLCRIYLSRLQVDSIAVEK